MKSTSSLFLLLSCFFFACQSENGHLDQPLTGDFEVPLRQWAPDDTRSITGYFAKRGLVKKTEKASPGYILFTPSSSTKTYLMNKEGAIVHSWPGELNSMQAYLLENGHLLRLERDPDFPVFAAGGQAGVIREYSWEGELLWEYRYASDKYLTHHDIEMMPNGNILAISYDAKTRAEAIAAGRDQRHVPAGGLWPDKIIEIKPNHPSGGDIVWEWRMWDHLIQDKYPDKANYGRIDEHPRKININVFDEQEGPPPPPEQIAEMIKHGHITSNASADTWHSDIAHTNAIVYHPQLDQIAISVPGYCEVFIIDHSTTTEEARGSRGGRSGHGGDLLYRWGNPQNYGRGGPEDQRLYFQHDVRWIEEGSPGAGNLLVFNNDIPGGNGKFDSAFGAVMQAQHPDPPVSIADLDHYSAVYEIAPAMNENNNYILQEDQAFGPAEPQWTYTAPDTFSFYSPFVSGAERLKNGHLIILSGAQGRFVEVDANNEIVWEYWSPYYDNYRLPDGTTAQPVGPFIFAQYRIKQYDPDYPGLRGKALDPIDPQPIPYVPEPVQEKKES